MKTVLLSAALPLMALSALPAGAQTVVERRVIITEREVPAETVERRTYYYRPYDNGPSVRSLRESEDDPSYVTVVNRSCRWLHRRAWETDSPYWWNRYRACRDED